MDSTPWLSAPSEAQENKATSIGCSARKKPSGSLRRPPAGARQQA
jgi:hypothetical protein